MKKNTLDCFRDALPAGALVAIVRSLRHDAAGQPVIQLAEGTQGLVLGACPNPWYNKVLFEGGIILDVFCSDLGAVEER